MPKTKKKSADQRRKDQKKKRLDDKSIVIKKAEDAVRERKKNNIAEKRKDVEFRTAEKQTKEEKRRDSSYRAVENEKMAEKRQNPAVRAAEKQKMSEKRQNPEYREAEYKKQAEYRAIPGFLDAKSKDMAERRQDPAYRGAENENRSQKRLEPEYREMENLKKRTNPQYRESEKQRMAKNREDERQKRKNSDNHQEGSSRKKPKKTKEIPPVTPLQPTEFNREICKGPTVTCSCCLRLWFATSCHELKRDKWENKLGRDLCLKVYNNGISDKFCRGCFDSIKKKKVPTFCSANYKIVFDMPEELKGLSILEERMVAARIPFMQIRQVGYARQCSIKGQIVNVPLEVDTTAKILPRNLEDTHTIQIKLKRKIDHKHAYIFETVRPAVILKALKYLVKQPLYVEEGITLSEERLEDIEKYINSQIDAAAAADSEVLSLHESVSLLNIEDNTDKVESERSSQKGDLRDLVDLKELGFTEEDIQQFLNLDIEDKLTQSGPIPPVQTAADTASVMDVSDDENSSDDEDDRPLNPGGQETLLDKNDICQNISYAPGENKIPKHLYLDKYAEELSFPTLFCGNKKEFSQKFHYAPQVKIQTQHRDRRFARTDFLLYMFKKSQLLHLLRTVCMSLRVKKNETGKYTAGDVSKPTVLKQLVEQDAGFMFLKRVKNSPAYWKKERGKLMSMIRQYNIPTFFFTVSAAETAWPELIQILSSIVDGKDLTFEQAATLPYAQKTRLIRTDPITCARYFEHRFRILFKHMRSENGTFKDHPIDHYYYRVEFQQRGSPHVHGILWLKGAPTYNKNDPNSAENCAKFADKYVTCDGALESVKDIIAFNIHRHCKSCKKTIKGRTICRYGIPFLPMDETVILEPRETQDKVVKAEMTDKFMAISAYLNERKDVDFDTFLIDMNISKKQYFAIIQYNIHKVTIFLKRKPKDCFVNNYNEEIFTMQRANMDIQFVLDPWACARYIVNYINKSHKGVSEIMKRAMDDIKKGNNDLKTRLKAVAGAFLNASEVSAQEAAYSLLQLHMHETCTSDVFINTRPIIERNKLLKPLAQIRKMDPGDDKIYIDGLLEHYAQRPDELADMCLAEFAAYYTFYSEKPNVRAPSLALKDGSGYVSKRGHAKIISFTRYGLHQDPINFYREQIMLYLPWRNEPDEVQNVDQQLAYSMHVETILENRKQFDVLDSRIIDEALEEAEKYENDVAAYVLNRELDDEYMPYGLDNPVHDPFDTVDVQDNVSSDTTGRRTFPTPFQITDDEYDDIISNLNAKQYEYLNHVLDSVERKQLLYNVIGGGAGVGKSRLISAIYQSLLRYYNAMPGNNPDSTKILLAAPTGKAAFGISGITLHYAFSLPVGQYDEELIPLNNDVLNTIHCNLIDLKLIIIDEYSMVGAKMLDYVNQRLQQIFKSSSPFGNISVILVGDIRQLSPVGDRWIFAGATHNPYKEICGTYLWDQFTYFELTEIMRQRQDKSFAIALNNMAGGTMTKEDIALIKSRELFDDKNIPDNVIHLFKSNNEVDAFNEKKLAGYRTEKAISAANDVVKGSCSEPLKRQLLDYARRLKKSESFGLMLNLILQVDAKYMVSINIDTQDGIVNGATGCLRKIEYEANNSNSIPKRVWLEFFDRKSGRETRNKHVEYMRQNNIPKTWTPIGKCARALKIKKGNSCLVERHQFPLLISEGITIHKSQGATYDQVAVHLSKGMRRSSIYVACSRATKLSGLYIFGQFHAPNRPSEKDLSFIELNNLRTNKVLKSKYSRQYVQDQNDKHIFLYHNVQSFNKHKKFMRHNPIFTNADILLLVETWLCRLDSTDFDGYDCFANLCDPNSQRRPYGICCYKKRGSTAKIVLDKTYKKVISWCTFQAVTFYYNDIYVVVVYIPPRFKIADARRCLDDDILKGKQRVIVIGDFNHDLSKDDNNNNQLKRCLENRGLSSKLDNTVPTTKSGTHIDWCFSDLNSIKLNVFNTIFSHHKAIAISAYTTDIKDLSVFQCSSQKPMTLNNDIQLWPTDSSDSDTESSVSYDDDDDDDDDLQIITLPSDSEDDLDASPGPIPLLNSDKVSCYANASIQCLLTLDEFRQTVAKADSNINRAISDVVSKRVKDCLEIRRFVGGIFVRSEQQDASEFLSYLIEILDLDDFGIFIKAFIYPNVTLCDNCHRRDNGVDTFVSVHNLYFPENCPNVLDFSEMLKPRSSDRQCERCLENLSTTSLIEAVNKYIVVHLVRTQSVNNQLIKIDTTFVNFNSENVSIDHFDFKVKAVVKHFGQTIQHGHYVADVKYGNSWWNCNDSTISRINSFDDTLKDVSLLILEKLG